MASRSKNKELSQDEEKLFDQRTANSGVFQFKQQFKSLQEVVANGN